MAERYLETDPEVRAEILRDLCDVGLTKAVGYLPLDAVTGFLGENPDDLSRLLRERGLDVRILSEAESVRSGALLAFDRNAAQNIVDRHRDLLTERGLPLDAEGVALHLMRNWFEMDDGLMPFIRELYNDKF